MQGQSQPLPRSRVTMVKRIILIVVVGGAVLVATTLGYGDQYRSQRRLGVVR